MMQIVKRDPQDQRRYIWTREMDALLGTMSDSDVADELGLDNQVIARRRNKLGIRAFMPDTKWTLEMDALLGTVPDQELAERFEVCRKTITYRRETLGILSWREQNRAIPSGVSADSREAGRIYAARRRHRRWGLPDTLTCEEWKVACEYFDNCCAYCGKRTFLGEDHLVPLSRGGPRTALNIVPACSFCNGSKHNRQAHIWIYEKFGMESGREIIERIIAYLMEVQRREDS